MFELKENGKKIWEKNEKQKKKFLPIRLITNRNQVVRKNLYIT